MIRFRHERFGGLLHLARPRAVLALDRRLVQLLGYGGSGLWAGRDGAAPVKSADGNPTLRNSAGIRRQGRSEPVVGTRLSAPMEVHLNLSERCAAACRSCYVNATPQGPELEPARACRILDRLAAMKVFHVALGGGEPLEYPALLEVAHHARARGIIPNLTTNGVGVSAELAVRLARVFGQINVSLDGADAQAYIASRGWAGFEAATQALRRLRSQSRYVGINFVLSRHSSSELTRVVQLASRLGLNEVELLRLKPGGRVNGRYRADRPTPGQLDRLLPLALRMALRHRVAVKLDCSLLPAICAHAPDPRVLGFFQIRGCEGGNLLASVDARGCARACSFSPWTEGPAEALPELWTAASTFAGFRGLEQRLGEPCASCEYLALCRGGCRAVAVYLTGDPLAPDPDCPRVREWMLRSGVSPSSRIGAWA